MNNQPNPEEHRRLVEAGLSKLRVVKEQNKRLTDPIDQLFARYGIVSQEVLASTAQIVKADRMSGRPMNHQALSQLVAKLYLDKLRQWSKDDLLQLVVVMSTHGMMEKLTSE